VSGQGSSSLAQRATVLREGAEAAMALASPDVATSCLAFTPARLALLALVEQGLPVKHAAMIVEANELFLALLRAQVAPPTPGRPEPHPLAVFDSGASTAPRVGQVVEQHAVSLTGLTYFTTPGATPGQELCEHVRRELGMAKVPGPELAKVHFRVPVNPVRLEQLSLALIDWKLYVAVTRCWGLAAAQGDRAVERKLFGMRQGGGPYVAPHLAPGVALFFPEL